MTVLEPLALEPRSTAILPALCLIAALASAAHAQVSSINSQPSPDGGVRTAAENPASSAVHHYGIIGQVARPGVYVCVHDDLTLAELVGAAGGTTPRAGRSAQIIRRGHAGPRLNAVPPSTAALRPGDVVVLEETAAASDEHSAEWIDVALVGLTEKIPVVLQVRPALTELPQLIAALHQEPVLINSVRIQRPSGPTSATAEPVPGRLSTGDVVVFETARIDQAALAQAESFPPPVLIPQRQPHTDLPIVIQPRSRGAEVSLDDEDESAQGSDETAQSELAQSELAPGELAPGTTLPVAAVAPVDFADSADSTAELPEDVWPLMHEPASVIASAMVPPLELPRTTSVPLSVPIAVPLSSAPDHGGPHETFTNAASDREHEITEDEVTEEIAPPQPVVAASLMNAAGRPTRPHLRTDTSAGVEPQRMASPPGEALAGRAADRLAQSTGTNLRTTGAQQVLRPAAGPGRARSARSLGMRAVSVGIFVLATAVFCFIASLLWSRLDDSTGLLRPIAAREGDSARTGPLNAHRTALDRLINNSLPLIEEPTPLPEGAKYHGEAVGRRRLRMDAQQTLSGPHFGASQQTSPPVAVQATAGTANTRSEREDSPAVPTAGQAVASPQRASAQGGLLDRVLVAMEREKRR